MIFELGSLVHVSNPNMLIPSTPKAIELSSFFIFYESRVSIRQIRFSLLSEIQHAYIRRIILACYQQKASLQNISKCFFEFSFGQLLHLPRCNQFPELLLEITWQVESIPAKRYS
jgi:hypothetical protein